MLVALMQIGEKKTNLHSGSQAPFSNSQNCFVIRSAVPLITHELAVATWLRLVSVRINGVQKLGLN